jgi:hypothetical protein
MLYPIELRVRSSTRKVNLTEIAKHSGSPVGKNDSIRAAVWGIARRLVGLVPDFTISKPDSRKRTTFLLEARNTVLVGSRAIRTEIPTG